MIDTKKNTKVVYLYVNEFKWTFSEDHERAVGHPKEKTLYRAVYNTDTNTYRGIYEMEGKMNGFYLKKLVSKESVSEEGVTGYTSDIIEITPSTILDCDLSSSDLTRLLKWIESNNKDLTDELWPPAKTPSPNDIKIFRMNDAKDFADMMGQIFSSKNPEFEKMSESLRQLNEVDPMMFEAITDLVLFIINDESVPDSFIDPSWISTDKQHGAGANIHSALQKLARYGGSDRRTNLEEYDLMGCIKDLLTEQIRRNINSIE